MTKRTKYSAWNLFAAGRMQSDWAPAWREAEPKPRYDAINWITCHKFLNPK